MPETAPAFLFLHGLASDETTWNDVVDALFDGQYQTILDGAVIDSGHGTSASNSLGICFRIRFGSDRAVGVDEDGLHSKLYHNGDGATFNMLGDDVWNAVLAIRRTNPSRPIILVGHSRGGLAARSFLQQAVSSSSHSAVTALLTIGTPHLGSPLGRVYQWLVDHPEDECGFNDPCKQDWDVYGDLKFCSGVFGKPLDAGAPSIKYLAPSSTELSTLNAMVSNLSYRDIVYGQIVSVDVPFGELFEKYGVMWDIMTRQIQFPDLSNGAIAHILNGNSRDIYIGDGVVPQTSQRMQNIPQFPAVTIWETPLRNDIHHVMQETGQTDVIERQLLNLRYQADR